MEKTLPGMLASWRIAILPVLAESAMLTGDTKVARRLATEGPDAGEPGGRALRPKDMNALAVLLPILLLAQPIPNPAIDMDGYLRVAGEAAQHRQSRRVTEAEFLRMRAEEGTIVLDARSTAKYAELHVAGAINLPFPDIAVESIERAIPDRDTRILIYCNNNFRNAEEAFPTKLPAASLNLSTFIALYTYGYRNVYELGPLVDLEESALPFEGTLAER